MKNWHSKKIHQELVTTLKTDACGRFQIKTWLQKFRNNDLSSKNTPRTGRPPLTLRQQLATFLQKYPCASVRLLAQHSMTSAPTIKEILQREMGLKKFSRRWIPHFLSPFQEIAHG
jgi:transposase